MRLILALAGLTLGSSLALAAGPPGQTSGPIRIVGEGSSGPVSGFTSRASGLTGTVDRTLGDRAAERFSVKDFGAKLDGSADDAPSYRAAKAAARPGQRITVPAGTRLTNSEITGPSRVWWDIAGTLRYPGGSPSPSIADDLTSSIVNDRTRLWWRENPVPSVDPVFRVERTDTSSQAGPDFIQIGNQTNCNLRNSPKSVYCNVIQLKSHGRNASSGDPAGHIALFAQAERMPDTPAGAPFAQAFYAELHDGTNLNDSADNGNAGMAMSEQDFYTNGHDTTNIRALVAYRIGSYPNTFTANTMAGSSNIAISGLPFALRQGNTVRGACLNGGFTTVSSYSYQDGSPSAVLGSAATTTGSCSMTVDVVPGEVGRGIELNAAAGPIGGRVGTGFGLNMPFYAAGFDTALGRSDNNAPAFRMAQGQRLAFDGSGTGYSAQYFRSLRYIDGSLKYQTQAGDVLQITDDGKVLAAGGLQIPELPAPSSTADTMGQLNDVRFNGPYMYRKTTSGWLRSPQFTSF